MVDVLAHVEDAHDAGMLIELRHRSTLDQRLLGRHRPTHPPRNPPHHRGAQMLMLDRRTPTGPRPTSEQIAGCLPLVHATSRAHRRIAPITRAWPHPSRRAALTFARDILDRSLGRVLIVEQPEQRCNRAAQGSAREQAAAPLTAGCDTSESLDSTLVDDVQPAPKSLSLDSVELLPGDGESSLVTVLAFDAQGAVLGTITLSVEDL